MEKRRAYLIVLLATVIVGAATFFASSLSATTVFIRNAGAASVEVRIETDIGESYPVGQLEPGGSKRVAVSGQDKALWLVVVKSDGTHYQSAQIYSTSGIGISGVINNGEAALSYAS